MINLVAKAGINIFDVKKGTSTEQPLPSSLELILENWETSIVTMILRRVQGFLKNINNSNQLRASLSKMVKDQDTIKRKVGLISRVFDAMVLIILRLGEICRAQ